MRTHEGQSVEHSSKGAADVVSLHRPRSTAVGGRFASVYYAPDIRRPPCGGHQVVRDHFSQHVTGDCDLNYNLVIVSYCSAI